jgi:ribokinase
LDDLSGRLAERRLLVMGGLNVDEHAQVDSVPVNDGSARIDHLETAFGGHAGNCACALARLGASVAVFGAVGADAAGCALIDDLNVCGVNTDRIQQIPGTPTGRVIIPSFPDCRYMLMYRGANDDWNISREEIRDAIAGFDAIVVFDPAIGPADILFDALESDSANLYWNPGGLLAGLNWTKSRLARANVLIMNRPEAEAAFAGSGRRSLRAYLENPGHRFIETLGPDGARMHTNSESLDVSGFPAEVLDETGAGDAFTAAFAAFDSPGLKGDALLRLANAVAACAIERLGARAGLPDLMTLARRWDLAKELSAYPGRPLFAVGAGASQGGRS